MSDQNSLKSCVAGIAEKRSFAGSLSERTPPSLLPFHYSAFGLRIASSIECPELLEISQSTVGNIVQTPEVTIVEKPLLPARFNFALDNQWFDITDEVLRFKINGVGQFEVSDGCAIQFERDRTVTTPGVHDDDIRVFLLGSCLGAILQQRKQLVLHASTAAKAQRTVIVMGVSGAGKSSALGLLLSKGWEMLTDDVTAISLDNERPFVVPAYGQMKFNLDSAERLGIDRTRLKWINRFKSKLALPCPERLRQTPAGAQIVIALDVDRNASEIQVRPLHGAEKLAIVHQNLYRSCFLEGFSLQENALLQVAQLVNHCRVYKVTRPGNEINSLQQLFDTIEKLTENE